MNNFFDAQRILDLIWKRKFHFILVGVIAIVLSGIFSGSTFIKPKFKSTARIYPSNLSELSEESNTEQMLEILNSNDIKFRMFDAFGLDTVYGIKKTDPHYISYMLDIYGENVTTRKTEYETVEIKVLDYSPQRASDMCDSIIRFYNQKVGTIHKAKDLEMVTITSNLLSQKNEEIDMLTNKLNRIRKESGIIDFGEQVPEVTRGYMTALATGRGSSSDTKSIKKLYDNLAEKGTKAYLIEKQFNSVVNQLDSLQKMHEVYLAEFNKDITYSHIVENPFPADKKSYPVRWLIVAFSTISAVFMALLIFLILDYRKEE